MSLLLGAWIVGLILSLLALGVFVSFRIFSFPDMTAEGTVTLGAAVAAAMIVAGYNPFLATGVATVTGAVAGATTGLLHTRLKINGLLAGIMVMTALYSVNLHVMGRSNIPLLSYETLATWASNFGGTAGTTRVLGRGTDVGDLRVLFACAVFVSLVTLVLFAFFRTRIGTAMRATGDNAQMIRAVGADDGNMITAGLALSNALAALAGALLAQYQGFADVQMGIGMLVLGLASVILGEVLVGTKRLGQLLVGTVLGAILFRLLTALALRWGLDPNDLKIATAAFVLAALAAPTILRKLRSGTAAGAGDA